MNIKNNKICWKNQRKWSDVMNADHSAIVRHIYLPARVVG